MAEFKVGDTVQIKNDNWAGRIGTVVGQNYGGYVIVDLPATERFRAFRATLPPERLVHVQTSEVTNDPVKSPDHYRLPNGMELMDFIQHLNFPRGSAMKYIWRAGKKSKETEIQDLRKAIENIEFEIKRVEEDHG